jgi:uncharacterized protein YlbG (UPF0298 family)
MENQLILSKQETDILERAIRFYTILSSIGGTKLTEREIQLISFTAIRGNISYSTNKEEFCKLYKSSFQTVNNLISKLKRAKFLIKDGPKVKVNPSVLVDFNKDIHIQVKLHG